MVSIRIQENNVDNLYWFDSFIFGARKPYPNTIDSILKDSLFGHQIYLHDHVVSIRIEENNVDNHNCFDLFLVPENPTLIRLTPYYRIVFSGTKSLLLQFFLRKLKYSLPPTWKRQVTTMANILKDAKIVKKNEAKAIEVQL